MFKVFSLPLAALALFFVLFAGVAHAQQDITPPNLVSVSFQPAHVDTGKGPQTITVTVHVSDDLSGVSGVDMFFQKPGTTQVAQAHVRTDGWSRNVSGDSLDGIYQATMELPQYAAYGQWEMYTAILQDKVGNRIDPWQTDDDTLRDKYHWPASYDSFVFTVGPDTQPPTSTQLFLPAVSAF